MSDFKTWMIAIRPKTLPAAVAPVLVGTSLAIRHGYISVFPALAAIVGALLLQILSNLANDYYDFLKGVDGEERQGPTRVLASGLMTQEELKRGIMVNILLAIILGLYLIYVGGLPILIIGIFSLIFAVLYSGGPYPLSSIGLGDLFVFIFFGLTAVGGTYYVQSLVFHPLSLIIAIPPGLLITAILVVNNYRDIETDKLAGKFTLAVFMGKTISKYYYTALLLVSYLVPIYLYLAGFSFWIFLPLLSVYFAVPLLKNVYAGNHGPIMNKTLGGTAKLSLIYCILFSIGILV